MPATTHYLVILEQTNSSKRVFQLYSLWKVMLESKCNQTSAYRVGQDLILQIRLERIQHFYASAFKDEDPKKNKLNLISKQIQ